MSFGDGPPYSEDEDLHSPVFRHRKNKSTGTVLIGRRGRSPTGRSIPSRYVADDPERGTLVSMNADGSETYYVNGGDSSDDGPGGEYVTYPAEESHYSHMMTGDPYDNPHGYEGDAGFDSEDDDPYARDFQFAVGCPDEEMHGKAVALFDFTREHENELPLVEGQVILVSYRHGQGWLVAEDPKTGESGLVPEEFVRLLRDIEGGLTSLNDELDPDMTENHHDMYISPESTDSHQVNTSTQDEEPPREVDNNPTTNGEEDKGDNNGKQPVVVPVSDNSEQATGSTPPAEDNSNDDDNGSLEKKPEDENHVNHSTNT